MVLDAADVGFAGDLGKGLGGRVVSGVQPSLGGCIERRLAEVDNLGADIGTKNRVRYGL